MKSACSFWTIPDTWLPTLTSTSLGWAELVALSVMGMLVALPDFGREQLLATLVVFRILYFLIPFAISISIMGSREIWLNVVLPWQERRRLSEACATAAAVPRPVKSRRQARG